MLFITGRRETLKTSLNDCNDLELVVNLSSSNSKQHDINAWLWRCITSSHACLHSNNTIEMCGLSVSSTQGGKSRAGGGIGCQTHFQYQFQYLYLKWLSCNIWIEISFSLQFSINKAILMFMRSLLTFYEWKEKNHKYQQLADTETQKKGDWELAVSQPQISSVLAVHCQRTKGERAEKACKRVGGKYGWLLNWGWTAVWSWSTTVVLAVAVVEIRDSALLHLCQLKEVC